MSELQSTAIETRKGSGTETADAEVRFTAPSDTGELEGIAVRFFPRIAPPTGCARRLPEDVARTIADGVRHRVISLRIENGRNSE